MGWRVFIAGSFLQGTPFKRKTLWTSKLDGINQWNATKVDGRLGMGKYLQETLEGNCRIASEAGYADVRTFVLPVADWWAYYYGPAEARLLEVRARHEGDREIGKRLDEIAREYDLFRRYSDAYGYVFYIMTKAGESR